MISSQIQKNAIRFNYRIALYVTVQALAGGQITLEKVPLSARFRSMKNTADAKLVRDLAKH